MSLFNAEIVMEFARTAFVAVIIIILGTLLIKFALHLLRKALNKTDIDPMLHKFFENILKVVLWAIVLLTALDYVGIKATTFLTVFAAAGVAVALALKDSLGNFAGGILIMFTKPFRKGEYVECCGVSGVIESIDLLYTTIMTIDNQVVTIPNGQLTNSTITNYSSQYTRRLSIDVHIAYESDIETARNALISLISKDSRVMEEPAPYCIVDKYENSSIVLSLRAWCKTSEFWDVKWDTQNVIKKTLDAVGITIPFPQMDIQIKHKGGNDGARN